MFGALKIAEILALIAAGSIETGMFSWAMISPSSLLQTFALRSDRYTLFLAHIVGTLLGLLAIVFFAAAYWIYKGHYAGWLIALFTGIWLIPTGLSFYRKSGHPVFLIFDTGRGVLLCGLACLGLFMKNKTA